MKSFSGSMVKCRCRASSEFWRQSFISLSLQSCSATDTRLDTVLKDLTYTKKSEFDEINSSIRPILVVEPVFVLAVYVEKWAHPVPCSYFCEQITFFCSELSSNNFGTALTAANG